MMFVITQSSPGPFYLVSLRPKYQTDILTSLTSYTLYTHTTFNTATHHIGAYMYNL